MTTLLPLLTVHPVLAALTVLAQKGPEPEDVKAGWLGLLVFLLLAAAIVFLGFSLRKHLGRVDFDEGGEPGADGSGGSVDGRPTRS